MILIFVSFNSCCEQPKRLNTQRSWCQRVHTSLCLLPCHIANHFLLSVILWVLTVRLRLAFLMPGNNLYINMYILFTSEAVLPIGTTCSSFLAILSIWKQWGNSYFMPWHVIELYQWNRTYLQNIFYLQKLIPKFLPNNYGCF